MIKRASAASAFTGGTVTSLIESTVASGSNFLKSQSGARLSLGSDSRYFSDNGALAVTGNLEPSASVSYDFGGTAKFWGTAYVHAVTLNSGQVRDSTSTARITANASTTNIYQSTVADGASAVAHEFDTAAAYTDAGAKIISIRNNDAEKSFVNKDGELELTTVSKGIILKSADGTRYRLIIANGGTVSISAA